MLVVQGATDYCEGADVGLRIHLRFEQWCQMRKLFISALPPSCSSFFLAFFLPSVLPFILVFVLHVSCLLFVCMFDCFCLIVLLYLFLTSWGGGHFSENNIFVCLFISQPCHPCLLMEPQRIIHSELWEVTEVYFVVRFLREMNHNEAHTPTCSWSGKQPTWQQ